MIRQIIIPFTSSPNKQTIVLSSGDFHCLGSFQHAAEMYRFSAGIHVDRESLLQRRRADVVIRPFLSLNERPAPLQLLKDATLKITTTSSAVSSTDKSTIDSTQTITAADGFKFESKEDYVHSFLVPENVRSVFFEVQASGMT